MKDIKSKIIENRQIADGFYKLSFHSPKLTTPKPGQFLTLKVSNSTAPLLRRPFAFANWDENSEIGEIIYQTRGISSEMLSKKISGDTIKILGPLGNGFPIAGISKNVLDSKGAIIVSGGVGLGPILFVAKELEKIKKSTIMVSGFRNASQVPSEAHILSSTVICTDDGSSGFNGNVVKYLDTLDESLLKDHIIISCGPLPMMKALNEFAKRKGLKSFVSMEEVMGCGVGACMGCVVKTTDERGSARVCIEGPVFESGVIKWN